MKSTSGISDTMVTLIDNGAFGYSWHGTVRSTASAQKAVWVSSSVKKGYCRFYSGTGVQRQLLRRHLRPRQSSPKSERTDVSRNRHSSSPRSCRGSRARRSAASPAASSGQPGRPRPHPTSTRRPVRAVSVAQFAPERDAARPPGGAPAHTGRVPLRVGLARRRRPSTGSAAATRRPTRSRGRKLFVSLAYDGGPARRDRPRRPPQRPRRPRRRGRDARHERRLDAAAAALAPVDACRGRARTTARSPTAIRDADIVAGVTPVAVLAVDRRRTGDRPAGDGYRLTGIG